MEIRINYSFIIFFYDPSKCIILEQLKHWQHIQNAYMGNIKFINQKSKCELGDNLHVVTCWLDANQCLKMKDFIFPSRNLEDLIT